MHAMGVDWAMMVPGASNHGGIPGAFVIPLYLNGRAAKAIATEGAVGWYLAISHLDLWSHKQRRRHEFADTQDSVAYRHIMNAMLRKEGFQGAPGVSIAWLAKTRRERACDTWRSVVIQPNPSENGVDLADGNACFDVGNASGA